jgi:hypothetical protein
MISARSSWQLWIVSERSVQRRRTRARPRRDWYPAETKLGPARSVGSSPTARTTEWIVGSATLTIGLQAGRTSTLSSPAQHRMYGASVAPPYPFLPEWVSRRDLETATAPARPAAVRSADDVHQ